MKKQSSHAVVLDKATFNELAKLVYVCVFLIICQFSLSAQDIITKKDGTDIKAIVLEVSSNEVKYKLFDEPDGVTYVDKKYDIVMITYESGRREIFATNS